MVTEKGRMILYIEIGNRDRQYGLQYLWLTGNFLPLQGFFYYKKMKNVAPHYSVGSSYA